MSDTSINKTSTAVIQDITTSNSGSIYSIKSESSKSFNVRAVSVINAFKAYEYGHPVLNNLNINVQQGIIYGLLGASGCGKTTILSCIAGLRHLDNGDIQVFGHRPGTKGSGIPGRTLGYMPQVQDIALYELFSIREILEYFGRIYGMTKTEIKARMEFLLSFLELPESTSSIQFLSGGQKRRTSLAVAMIHQPEILILDEPTVGVDPLLRESIWTHLLEMVEKRGTTVIITTHYIEEANQSNMVGIMRNGQLLAEQSPTSLLEQYQSDSLESVVLKLCKEDDAKHRIDSVTQFHLNLHLKSHINIKRQKENKFQLSNLDTSTDPSSLQEVSVLSYKVRHSSTSSIAQAIDNEPQLPILTRLRERIQSDFDKTISVVMKNFITLIRYPWFPFILIMTPSIQIILFSLIIAYDPKNIRMGVVNKEFDDKKFLDVCKQVPTTAAGCFPNRSSCEYTNLFPKEEIQLIPFATEEEALQDTQNGNSWGFITIPENYTQHLRDRSLQKNFIDNETILGTTLTTRLDMSSHMMSNFLSKKLLTRYQDYFVQMATDCDEDPRTVELPLKFNAIYGSVDTGYFDFLQPAHLQLIIFVLPMASCLNYISDRKAGTLDRSMVAGVKSSHILAAFMISEGTLIIIQLALCLSFLFFVFGFHVQGSIPLFVLASYLQGMTGLSIGFLIGTLCNHEIEAILLLLGIYLPLMASSGVTWPLQALEKWVRTIYYIFPLSLNIESVRSVASKGWGFTHSSVWPGFAVMIGWIIFASVLSAIVIKIKRK